MSEARDSINLNMILADFNPLVELTDEVIKHRRARICDLEKALESLDESQSMEEYNEGRIHHHFGTGVYGRELFIPAGQVIVSKIHRGKTLSVIAQGEITVISEEGAKLYKAPSVFVSPPFTKRVVVSHTDVVWVTSHENAENSEDLEEIESRIIAKDFTELNQIKGGQ
jgi:hypothetical protein